MTIHTLNASRETMHGAWSAAYQPVLTIADGDTVRFTTADARWGLGKDLKVEPREAGWARGHALTGPVYVQGAQPGMALAVQINAVRPSTWGWNSGGGWPLAINERLGIAGAEDRLWIDWTIEPERMLARNQYGRSVALRPFMGVMGVAPGAEAGPGPHPTRPPGPWGGNIDCKELVPGSTLFLPVGVEGCLFSVGDGHAAQGDGEVCGQGIECAMELVDLTFRLEPAMSLTMPRAHTPAGWITFGFSEDLNEAANQALEGMVRLIRELFGADVREALALASVAVDLRVTQTVNAVQGVHAVLPHGAIR